MTDLSTDNAAEWLARNGWPATGGRFSELGGGVSNVLILAELPESRAALKQSLGKLRVEKEWLSDRGRIFREAAAMRWLEGKVSGGRVPRVLLEDRENFVFAMEAAPAEAETWKTLLMRGEVGTRVARAAGTMLGSVIRASWRDRDAREIFGDQTVFDQLRIDPYYRFTASQHPALAGEFEGLMSRSSARRVSLVHGDWSPKNLLVAQGEMGAGEIWAIDWEVVHFGDPSFDAGFLLNHLLMKSIAMPRFRERLAELAKQFLAALVECLPEEAGWMESAALEHLPALLLARVDGKSPAEYLNDSMRVEARRRAIELFHEPARSVAEVFTR